MTFPVLRRHQSEAVAAAEAAFRSGTNRVLWDMCVGSGKSLTYAESARREIERGGRVLLVAPNRELVEQTATAFRSLGITTGINSAALGERTWRAPAIVASINSVYSSPASFGPISLLIEDEAHMAPHGQRGMLRALRRGLGDVRVIGGTGTPYRMQGGSLVDGEDAPYEEIVYHYPIIDGIRDGFLVTPFSAAVDDKLDASGLRIAQGEYTGSSQDVQMLKMMDNHLVQMIHYGRDRRSWLVFEASKKAAIAMAERMNAWGISTGLILGDRTRSEAAHRRETVEAFRAGRLRAVVNVECLTTGFDVQQVDMLVCRRRTKSLSLWVQIVGRLLRTIGGNIEASVAAGKSDGLLLDFADNVSEFGPLDFIRPKDTRVSLVSCESCNKRVPAAAARCWNCDSPMFKLCPACLEPVEKGTLDCPHCNHDMRTGAGGSREAPKLLDTPSGAALISNYRNAVPKAGGWLPIQRMWQSGDGFICQVPGERVGLPDSFNGVAKAARWLRMGPDGVSGVLVPNGSSRTSARQYDRAGAMLIVPMPQNDVDNS